MELVYIFAHGDKVWELQPAVGLGEEESIGVNSPESTIYTATW